MSWNPAAHYTKEERMHIDIRTETAAICQKLGLDPADVASLQWWPGRLTATVYKTKGGAKYVDEITNEPAREQRHYEVHA